MTSFRCLDGLPADVADRVGEFVGRLDQHRPGLLIGCYVVGSAALGDFSDRTSNIDLVAVSDQPWTSGQSRAAEQAAHLLRRRGRDAAVACVTFVDLAGDGRPYRAETDGGPLLNPFTRDLLVGAPTMRGPERPTVAQPAGGIEAWAVDLLRRQWRPWARVAQRRPGAKWMKRSLANPVLDVCRLYGAARGHVLSKAQAADLVLSEATATSRSNRVIQEALSYRQGVTTSNYWGPVERKGDAIRLIKRLADAAGS